LSGLLLLQPGAAAQTPRSVGLTVTVTDRQGNYVMGLSPDAFEISNEKAVKTASFHEMDEPMSIGILIDTSSSMQEPELQEFARPKPITEAVAYFLKLGNPANEYFLIAFDKTTKLLADWQSGKSLPSAENTSPGERGFTVLYDACLAALDKLKQAHHSKQALLIFSDGLDSKSQHRFAELRRAVERNDVLVYAIAPRGVAYPTGLKAVILGMQDREAHAVLGELAEITGGFVYFPETKQQLEVAAERIAIEMRHQYRFAFQPDNARIAGKSYRLKVQVKPPPGAPDQYQNVRVRTRRAYFAP
jgi:VWFA-related protein